MSLNLSALAVRERSITVFLIFLIAVAGTLAFFQLGRAEDPPFTVKQLTVITAWPGATAQEMQDQVAEPLEKRLQELKWYDRTETYTRPGLAFTMVSLVDRTPPSQVQEEFYQARKKLDDEATRLPAGVIGPMVNDEFADVTFALFALKAKGEPQRLLVRDAESLRQRLLQVVNAGAGVAVDGHGAQALTQFGLQLGRQRKGVFHRVELDHAGRVLDRVGVHGLDVLPNKAQGVRCVHGSHFAARMGGTTLSRSSAARAWA